MKLLCSECVSACLYSLKKPPDGKGQDVIPQGSFAGRRGVKRPPSKDQHSTNRSGNSKKVERAVGSESHDEGKTVKSEKM